MHKRQGHGRLLSADGDTRRTMAGPLPLLLLLLPLAGADSSAMHFIQAAGSVDTPDPFITRARGIITPPTLEETFDNVAAVREACLGDHTALVLAMAGGYVPEHLCPFVRSWHRHAPTSRLVIFTDAAAVSQHAILSNRTCSPNLHVLQLRTSLQHGATWHFWRQMVFLRFLEHCRALRSGTLPPVMLTDARDALAQGDVWAEPAVVDAVNTGGVIFPLEGNPGEEGAAYDWPIAQDEWMKRGLRACYDGLWNGAQWQVLFDGRYSCSGVSLGNGNAVLEFQRALVDFLLLARMECWQYPGGDQPVHNWLLNLKLQQQAGRAFQDASQTSTDVSAYRFKAITMSNGQGPVYTSQLGRPIQLDAAGQVSVVRGEWSITPVYVHQYDRYQDVLEAMFNAYPCACTLPPAVQAVPAIGLRTVRSMAGISGRELHGFAALALLVLCMSALYVWRRCHGPGSLHHHASQHQQWQA